MMENEWFLGFSTSIKERIDILSEKKLTGLQHLSKWRERKTLLTDLDFENMLKQYQVSREQFNLGVSTLNEADLKKLFNFVKTQKWYQLHKKLFLDSVCFENTLDAALRFHYAYFQSQIESILQHYPFITFSNEAILELKIGLLNDLKSIADKTLVWDVHNTIEKLQIKETSPEQEFISYLQLRFGNAEKTQYFFLEYPTLAKLLSTRLLYAINNFSIFLTALNNALDELNKTFQIVPPLQITQFALGSGDSHCCGKTPIYLKINDTKLVFKYRSNQIGSCFQQLLSWVKSLNSDFNFYRMKFVTAGDYTFEEFINHESCESKQDVEDYYRNYGNLLGIIYWLNSVDLHMENLIAKGKYPVIIDVETLLFQEDRRVYTQAALKNRFIEKSSIIKSGLLPLKEYYKRQLNINALTGTKQKLPYKVRKLANENTSEIIYQLEEGYYMGSNNIPLLKDQEVDYHKYITFIEKGFLITNNILLQEKSNFIEKIKEFSDCDFRVLLRDTQDYGNFLNFATHPSCMIDYIEREKIFENLWSCSFIDISVVSAEIKELLNNDIPYFISKSSSCRLDNLYESKNEYYNNTAVELLSDHINEISPLTINNSFLLMKESLNILSYNLHTYTIPAQNQDISDLALSKAADIGDMIIENILIDKEHNLVIWAQVSSNEEDHLSLDYPLANLYNGTSGLYIFMYYLNHYVPKEKYKNLIKILENEVFSGPLEGETYLSAFWGKGYQLTCAVFAYHLTKSDKHLIYIQKLLQELTEKKINGSDEWIYGKASLISLLCLLYADTKLQDILSFIENLTEQVSVEKIDIRGFAHGYSGILYALKNAALLIENDRVIQKITIIEHHLSQSLNDGPKLTTNSWCNGYIGISSACSTVKINNYDIENEHIDSCICHGQFGTLDYMMNQFLKGEIKENDYIQYGKNLIQPNIHLKSEGTLIPLGLFTGLSGIGYQLLRYKNPDMIPSILFFQ